MKNNVKKRGNILIINSLKNEYVKKTLNLKNKKYRKIENKFISEGKVYLEEAVFNNWEVADLFCNCKIEEKFKKTYLFNYLIEKGTNIIFVTQKILEKILEKTNPSDYLMVVKKKIFKLKSNNNNKVFLALDRIRDPGNLGSIFRTMNGAEVNCCFLIDECVDPYSPEVVKASMGSIFSINFHIISSEKFLDWVKRNRINLIGSSALGSKKYFNFEWPLPMSLLLGNESNGISPKLKKQCLEIIKIPIKNRVESLNISVSAGILIYDIIRKYPI